MSDDSPAPTRPNRRAQLRSAILRPVLITVLLLALYFTVTVFSTVGFGDILAVSDTGRAVVTIQMISNLVLLGIGGRVLYGAIERSQKRRAPADPD